MIIAAAYRNDNPRLRFLTGGVALGLALLLVALFRVQVLHTDRFGDRLEAQSLRRIRLPSARGEITDRAGVVLADNRPSYDIAMYLDQLGRFSKRQDVARIAQASIFSLGSLLNLPVNTTDREVRLHYERRRPIPLPLWKDLPPPTVAAFVERGSTLPGTDLLVTPVRQYPHGTLAAHILGFCGKSEQTPEAEVESFYYYQPDLVGKQGVERGFDADLRGAPGGRTIRVNPAGVKVEDLGVKPAERGNRLVLTIDARIQRFAEEALLNAKLPAGKELRGAVIALDPRSGEILALASVPAFDPNLFNPGTPASEVNAVLQNPGNPLLNRAIGARYAPGSTFKPITLLAGLEAGTVTMSDTAVCSGGTQIGNRFFGCWNRQGHGRVEAGSAMAASCDVWFYQAGQRTGVEAIARMAREFGLGQPTGLDYSRDAGGLVPTPAWKREHHGDRWWDGDTAQMAIGQSFLLTTPLQMANVAAMLANGGTRWRPHILKRITTPAGVVLHAQQPQVVARLRARRDNIEAVRQTMLAAVNSSLGTSRQAAVRGLNIAGKTGTAEHDTRHGRINRAWFIGFAPYEEPSLALAVLIEEGQSGGHTAAPVAGEIFAKVFGKEMARAGGGGD
jgi:penicillin-binding protein 2